MLKQRRRDDFFIVSVGGRPGLLRGENMFFIIFVMIYTALFIVAFWTIIVSNDTGKQEMALTAWFIIPIMMLWIYIVTAK